MPMVVASIAKNRIFTITGFMLSGKTCLGKKASDLLKLNFIDLDEFIESRAAKSIASIFESSGENFFRKYERELFEEVLESCKNKTILSVGGGFPILEENQRLMKKTTVIFLNTPIEEILSRVTPNEIEKRPLLNSDFSNIKKLYEKRYPIYIDTADIVAKNYDNLVECLRSFLVSD